MNGMTRPFLKIPHSPSLSLSQSYSLSHVFVDHLHFCFLFGFNEKSVTNTHPLSIFRLNNTIFFQIFLFYDCKNSRSIDRLDSSLLRTHLPEAMVRHKQLSLRRSPREIVNRPLVA
ncbi:hypothetical protein ACS0TY_007100 [Phlomoides rotata]